MSPEKKKYVKRPSKPKIPCKHCGEIFEYKVGFCKICKMHVHEALYGDLKEDTCGACRSGLSTAGRNYQREHRIFFGVKGITAAYDFPEWYDMQQEISNMTVMPVWVDYESGNAH